MVDAINTYWYAGEAKNQSVVILCAVLMRTLENEGIKQKVLEELFGGLTRLETIEQAITNRRLHYERWLNERGYFGEWDSIEDLVKGKDNAYQFGIASGIYDVCTALLKMMERKEDGKQKE